MKKLFALSGMLASIVYVGTVVLGGILRPGYSHVTESVSELVAAGAANKPLLSSLFIIYNLLCSIFAIGLFQQVKNSTNRKVSGTLGAISLLIVGFIGLLLELFFPQDPGGPAVTLAGTMHIILAGVAALGTMIAIVGTGLWLRNVRAMKYYTVYSLVIFAIIFISGGSTPILGLDYPFFGILERITIGSFIIWLFVTAAMMYFIEIQRSTPIA
ncbi:MAG TPA: DUF998 domain-containing protein [Anaerolineaceae bacterium]|nr:DUF998 domain-containing protein [Anaerolineaceae bacterium]